MRKRVSAYQRKLLSVSLALLFPVFLFSQATTPVAGGIINTYHRVTDTLIGKAGVRVDNTTGLSYGNLVLVIQMKGATIQTTATSSTWGDTISLNQAGNYEVATICAVIDDTVFFFHHLMNSYDTTKKVQLVKFAEYYSADINGTVKAASWDSTTGTGGVLAIRAEETITLNAPLFADSTGFRGGGFLQWGVNCLSPGATSYASDGNNTGSAAGGAFKGEGVALFASNQDGGRGAPANGGGGGNNHNNGGAGGANLSAAGNGGGNYSTVGCTGEKKGLAGKALRSWGGTKVFFGGGGGAGHVNNNTPPVSLGGGHGGGLIIVIAKDIIGNGQKISANGQVGGNAGSDGASGGGGGGTIIMDVLNSYTGPLTIEANGGNGGLVNNQSIANRCYGAGGGGSGGVIYFNGAVPAITTNVNPGAAGANTSVVGCGAPIPADPGTAGSIITSYEYRTSTDPSSYCEFLLPVKLTSFNAHLTTDKKVKLEWEIANPQDARSFTIERMVTLNNWQTIKTITANNNTRIYGAFDLSPKMGDNIYRLRMTGKDNSVTYSMQRRVVLKLNTSFVIYPNPAGRQITITGTFERQTTINFTDINGRYLFSRKVAAGSGAHAIELPSLPAGVYLIKAENIFEKLVIR